MGVLHTGEGTADQIRHVASPISPTEELMSEPQRESTASGRDATTAKVTLSPIARGDVEAHAAARTIDVLRITLEPVEGDPIVLEPAGVGAEDGYRIVSGQPEVEAHRFWGFMPTPPEVEAHRHRT